MFHFLNYHPCTKTFYETSTYQATAELPAVETDFLLEMDPRALQDGKWLTSPPSYLSALKCTLFTVYQQCVSFPC